MKTRTLLLLLPLASAATWVIAQEALPPTGDPNANPAAGATGDPAATDDGEPLGAAADPLANVPPTDARHYSYAIGLDIGTSFHKDQLKFDVDSLVAGVKDGLAAAQPRFSPEMCAAAVQRLARERAEGIAKRSADFLTTNAKQPGIQTTPTGLQYKVLKAGTGPSPTAASKVRANYRGTFIDGTVFDASEEGKPAAFEVGRVIPGWTEALQKMKVGDKWQLFLPSNLAYGPQGFGDDIPPNAALIFEVELIGID